MAETKYGKYIYKYDSEFQHPLGPMLARMDNNTFGTLDNTW